MAKIKTRYVCQECGNQSAQWVGKCNACGNWNTFVEEKLEKTRKGELQSSLDPNNKPILLKEVEAGKQPRMTIHNKELERVLGGGVVPGSLILFGGEPGIGKSTLMLQTAMEQNDWKILYISGEESATQIRMRAERIGAIHDQLYVLAETNTDRIFTHIDDIQPDVLVIDSIQTIHSSTVESAPGSVSQIRECTAEIMKKAKTENLPVFLIGHITKEGSLAGPKVLEHMVDVVLQFEGDRHHSYRIVRGIKNRFGSTNELGIFEMVGSGLREVSNPSEILIHQQDEDLSGAAIAVTMEGLRPMLIEIQALVSSAVYGTPQRSATGFDIRRMNMLLAVLEKRCGFKLGMKDVFLNMAGGIRVDDPSSDLAVIAAILSSGADMSVARDTCFAGEVGLSGEVRPVNRVDQRIAEADKLGFKRIFISKQQQLNKEFKFKLKVVPISKVSDLLKTLFE
ncbi:MAG: DNA repair protein RadA [Flavobacteriales bacterium]|nr:DNA repair protein RadA [Flavobacteriales bacterium]